MLSMKRESHHMPVMERFAPDGPAPDTDDPVLSMAHRLSTKAGRALYGLRKQTVEPVFGIIKRVMGWRQMSMRGLDKAQGEWTHRDDGVEHQALACAASSVRGAGMQTQHCDWKANTGSQAIRGHLRQVAERASAVSRQKIRLTGIGLAN